MRVLALDYGSARCGTAVSDASGTIASPLHAVTRPDSRAGLRELRDIVAERAVERVVVGLPLSLSGGDSEQTRRSRAFASRLQRALGASVPVELYDERLTTRMASRLGGGAARADEDSRAAAHLLEGWLAAGRRGRSGEGG
ncbi:MAG: Holliday junction resolvase RuvX [Acidobacteriota bacterium]|nr:Holliday junction resolvase RuvX [Acidobacteriota bacterium]